jgi:hypothetical protein
MSHANLLPVIVCLKRRRHARNNANSQFTFFFFFRQILGDLFYYVTKAIREVSQSKATISDPILLFFVRLTARNGAAIA